MMKKLIMHKLLTTVFLLFVVSMFFCTTASAVQVFFDDFNSGAADLKFTGAANSVEGVEGFSAFGFSGDFLRNADDGNPVAASTILTLTGLPTHTSIDLNFLLAIIDSWDGDEISDWSKDKFNVEIDGVGLVFSEYMSNWSAFWQPYSPPAGVELTTREYADLGFNSRFPDGAYDMGLDLGNFDNIAHTDSTLTIEWFASGDGWQGGTDESWAIDNVEVILNGTVVPEPTTIALLGIGLVGLAGAEVRRRRKKKVVGKS